MVRGAQSSTHKRPKKFKIQKQLAKIQLDKSGMIDPQGGSNMVSLFRILSLLGAVWVSLAHVGHHEVNSGAHLGIRRGLAREHMSRNLQRDA
jgi:hypothetical protein